MKSWPATAMSPSPGATQPCQAQASRHAQRRRRCTATHRTRPLSRCAQAPPCKAEAPLRGNTTRGRCHARRRRHRTRGRRQRTDLLLQGAPLAAGWPRSPPIGTPLGPGPAPSPPGHHQKRGQLSIPPPAGPAPSPQGPGRRPGRPLEWGPGPAAPPRAGASPAVPCWHPPRQRHQCQPFG